MDLKNLYTEKHHIQHQCIAPTWVMHDSHFKILLTSHQLSQWRDEGEIFHD